MDELNIKVHIPEGYEIDKEKSTFENIVLKPVKVNYTFVSRNLFYNKDTYYVADNGNVASSLITTLFADPNNCTSRKQAEKLLAINQLMNVTKYLNGDWKPDWKNGLMDKYSIVIEGGIVQIYASYQDNRGVTYFRTRELAAKAIEILGKETIKLALSTDW